MNESENIAKAAEALVEAIKAATNSESGVAVYYVYEHEDNFHCGRAGEMSIIEGLGAVEYIRHVERDYTLGKMKQ